MSCICISKDLLRQGFECHMLNLITLLFCNHSPADNWVFAVLPSCDAALKIQRDCDHVASTSIIEWQPVALTPVTVEYTRPNKDNTRVSSLLSSLLPFHLMTSLWRPFCITYLCLSGGCVSPCYSILECPDTILVQLLKSVSRFSLRHLSVENQCPLLTYYPGFLRN